MEFIFNKSFENLPFKAKLPKNFINHIQEKADKFFIYDRFKKVGRCSNCNNLIQYGETKHGRIVDAEFRPMDTIKKGDVVICPCCRQRIIAMPYTSYFGSYRKYIELWNYRGKLYYILVYSNFINHTSQECDIKPYELGVYAAGVISSDEQKHYLLWSCGGWQKNDNISLYHENFNLTSNEKKNAAKAIEKSFLKRVDILHGFRIYSAKGILTALSWCAKHPQAEYLQKQGIGKLCVDSAFGITNYIRPNWNAKTVHGTLRLSPQDIDKLKQWGMFELSIIPVYRKLKDEKQKITKELLELCKELFVDYGEIDTDFFSGNFRNIRFGRTARYINKQFENGRPQCSHGYGIDERYVLNLWKDYVRQIRALEYPNDDYYLYPKDIREAHDRISDEIKRREAARKEKENELKNQKMQKQLKQLEKLCYEDDKFLIRPLRNHEEFLSEGLQNHNCVASYFGRAADGRTAIFVIRDKNKPDVSLVTLELRGEKIIQCYGKGNSLAPDDIMKFADEWVEKIVKMKGKRAA